MPFKKTVFGALGSHLLQVLKNQANSDLMSKNKSANREAIY